jgi:hypothetical protein
MHPSPDVELEIISKNILHHETQESTHDLNKRSKTTTNLAKQEQH